MKRGEQGPFCWELPEWPAFRWDAMALSGPLGHVHFKQGELVGRMQTLGFSGQSRVTVEALSQDALKSSAIEGIALDLAQVRSSVARRLHVDLGSTVRSAPAAEGIAAVLVDATQRFTVPLTPERLFQWHSMLFPENKSDMEVIRTGAWRDTDADPMQVISGRAGHQRVHFSAPPADKISFEMRRFLGAYNVVDANMSGVCHAALMHLWFITIHPFEDGNGRIARALTDMALAASEASPQRFYSMSAQIKKEQSAYYEVLERTQRGNLDVTEWLLWFCACLGRAIDSSTTTTVNVLDKARFWAIHASIAFNARQKKVLERMLEGFEGKLTSSKWAKINKCSQDTAARDIQHLVETGILRKDAAGGRSTSYSMVEF
jgi:Fic family protein